MQYNTILNKLYGGEKDKKNNMMFIVIGIIVLICICSSAIGVFYVSNKKKVDAQNTEKKSDENEAEKVDEKADDEAEEEPEKTSKRSKEESEVEPEEEPEPEAESEEEPEAESEEEPEPKKSVKRSKPKVEESESEEEPEPESEPEPEAEPEPEPEPQGFNIDTRQYQSDYTTFLKNNNGYGKNYLTTNLYKLKVNCNNKPINKFTLNNYAGNFKYDYKCSNGGDLNTQNIVSKSTPPNDSGDGVYTYLDKHDVDCGEKGIISQFQLVDDKTNKKQNYNYKCITSNKPLECRTVTNTPTQKKDNNASVLKNQNIDCNEDEVLNQFKLNTNTDDIYYSYKCCKTT